LSGAPDRDIKIVFSGIRPGEKLQEARVGTLERAEPSRVEGILQVQPAPLSAYQMLLAQIATLERFASRNDGPAVLQQLRDCVRLQAGHRGGGCADGRECVTLGRGGSKTRGYAPRGGLGRLFVRTQIGRAVTWLEDRSRARVTPRIDFRGSPSSAS